MNWLGINNTVDCIQESQKEHHCSHKRAVMSQATNMTLQTILKNTEVPHACYPPAQLLTL